MDVTMSSGDLERELAIVERGTQRKATIPIYGCALFDATPAGLELAATDAVMAVRATCQASTARPGRAALPLAPIYNIVRTMPGATVRLSQEAGARAVRFEASTGFKASFQTLAVEDFPTLPDRGSDVGLTVKARTLSALFARTRFCIQAREDARFAITGALVEPSDHQLRIVATDGHRLAKVEGALVAGGGAASLLPRRMLDALAPLLAAEEEAEVDYAQTESHVHVRIGARRFACAKIAGKFPDYQRVIPSGATVSADIPREALASALGRAIVVSPDYRAVLSFREGMLEVASASAEIGSATENVAVAHQGAPMKVGINASQLAEFLAAVEADSVRFAGTDGDHQFVLTAADGAIAYTYVVMPIRL